MQAVERFLREREAEFREKLRVYNVEYRPQAANLRRPFARGARLSEMEVLGFEDGIYKLRVLFKPNIFGGVGNHIISLRLDGDDFEIVGHEVPGSVKRKGTGRKAAARPD